MPESAETRFERYPAAAVRLSGISTLTPVYSEGRVYAISEGIPICVFAISEEDKNDVQSVREYLDLCVDDIVQKMLSAKETDNYLWCARDFDYKKRRDAWRIKRKEEIFAVPAYIQEVNTAPIKTKEIDTVPVGTEDVSTVSVRAEVIDTAPLRTEEASVSAEHTENEADYSEFEAKYQLRVAADQKKKQIREAEEKARREKLRTTLIEKYGYVTAQYFIERRKYEKTVRDYLTLHEELSPKDRALAACLIWFKDIYLAAHRDVGLTQHKLYQAFTDYCSKHYLFTNQKGHFLFSKEPDYYQRDYYIESYKYSDYEYRDYVCIGDMGAFPENIVSLGKITDFVSSMRKKSLFVASSASSPNKNYAYCMLHPSYERCTGPQLCDAFFGFNNCCYGS